MVGGVHFWGWNLREQAEEESVGVIGGGEKWGICLSPEDLGWGLGLIVLVHAFGGLCWCVRGEGQGCCRGS